MGSRYRTLEDGIRSGSAIRQVQAQGRSSLRHAAVPHPSSQRQGRKRALPTPTRGESRRLREARAFPPGLPPMRPPADGARQRKDVRQATRGGPVGLFCVGPEYDDAGRPLRAWSEPRFAQLENWRPARTPATARTLHPIHLRVREASRTPKCRSTRSVLTRATLLQQDVRQRRVSEARQSLEVDRLPRPLRGRDQAFRN